jgi:hypothetical protein
MKGNEAMKSKNFTFTLRGQQFNVTPRELRQFAVEARNIYHQASDAVYAALASDVETIKTSIPQITKHSSIVAGMDRGRKAIHRFVKGSGVAKLSEVKPRGSKA